MADAKVGIQETKEAMDALNEVSVLLIKNFKDGFQSKDIASIAGEVIASSDLRDCVMKAFNGMSAIPSEVKDLDAGEIFELVSGEVKFVIDSIQSLKA